MAKPNGGPAFPVMQYASGFGGELSDIRAKDGGLTLRDYFAAAALPAVLQVPQENAAESAYAIADKMLAEREKA
jgi:hypothetical protein